MPEMTEFLKDPSGCKPQFPVLAACCIRFALWRVSCYWLIKEQAGRCLGKFPFMRLRGEKSMVQASIRITVPPEKLKEVLQTFKAILALIRNEPGCIS